MHTVVEYHLDNYAKYIYELQAEEKGCIELEI